MRCGRSHAPPFRGDPVPARGRADTAPRPFVPSPPPPSHSFPRGRARLRLQHGTRRVACLAVRCRAVARVRRDAAAGRARRRGAPRPRGLRAHAPADRRDRRQVTDRARAHREARLQRRDRLRRGHRGTADPARPDHAGDRHAPPSASCGSASASSIPPSELPALLGHELQHAVEIAEREEVRDEEGVRRLYLEIGRQGSGDSFETDAALDVEWQVRLECRQHAATISPATLATALLSLLAFAPPLFAQTDEIQVYDGGLAPVGTFNLTLHNNFTPHGIEVPAFPGAVVADKSFNGVPEFALGVTNWFEAGLYLPLYSCDKDTGFGLDGFKLRALFAVPGRRSPALLLRGELRSSSPSGDPSDDDRDVDRGRRLHYRPAAAARSGARRHAGGGPRGRPAADQRVGGPGQVPAPAGADPRRAPHPRDRHARRLQHHLAGARAPRRRPSHLARIRSEARRGRRARTSPAPGCQHRSRSGSAAPSTRCRRSPPRGRSISSSSTPTSPAPPTISAGRSSSRAAAR